MAYCTTNWSEETAESKLLRKKDREIESLRDVIVEQAKALTDSKRMYLEAIDRNTEIRDELNDMWGKVAKIKDLLMQAKDAHENAKSQRQRDISIVRLDTLYDVLDILEGNEEK